MPLLLRSTCWVPLIGVGSVVVSGWVCWIGWRRALVVSALSRTR